MSEFHDVAFAPPQSLVVRGGPERATEIVVLGSGRERRLARWAHGRRRYALSGDVRNPDDLSSLIAFFEARMGRLFAFRFRDPMDWRSCAPLAAVGAADQILGLGTGVRTSFQLVKTYGAGAAAYVRPIVKPVAGSVRVSVDGVEVSASAFACDGATGMVTFTAAPANGAVVRAGFAFDTPVRFDVDALDLTPDGQGGGKVAGLTLIEVAL